MPSHADRQALKHQQRAVSRLLDSRWDPMGVYADGDGPIPGEHEAYAWEVLARLREGVSVSELAVALGEIRAREMELGPGPEDVRAAEALVEWYRTTGD